MNPGLCNECKLPAYVGWGTPAVWLCIEHFEVKLAEARAIFDRVAVWVERGSCKTVT